MAQSLPSSPSTAVTPVDRGLPGCTPTVEVQAAAREVDTGVSDTDPASVAPLIESGPAPAVAPRGIPNAPATWNDSGESESRGAAPPVPVAESSTRTGDRA
jgi:hypothetical protein